MEEAWEIVLISKTSLRESEFLRHGTAEEVAVKAGQILELVNELYPLSNHTIVKIKPV